MNTSPACQLTEIVRSSEGESILHEGRRSPSSPCPGCSTSRAPARPPSARPRSSRRRGSGRRSASIVWAGRHHRGPPDPGGGRGAALVTGASLDIEGNPRLVLDPSGLVAAATAAQRARDETPRKPAKRPILVIDDSLTTRMLEQSILESAGYEVDIAVSGEEGLEKANERRYGLFLVDVEMPGMDGFEFVAQTRSDPALRDIPAILVTSLSSPEDRRRGAEVGAHAYIVKGEFDQGQLLTAHPGRDRMSMARIRVLVVEDSLTVRKRLLRGAGCRPRPRGGRRGGGRRAGDRAVPHAAARRHHPRHDAAGDDRPRGHRVHHGLLPTPILIVSASTNRGELFKTYDALAAGAVDVLEKPRGTEPAERWERKLIAPVKLVSRIRVITHPRGRLALSDPARRARPDSPHPRPAAADRPGPRLVAIGASTGGPSAIIEILRGLPAEYPLPILFVLHIGEAVWPSFADWLDGQSPIRVALRQRPGAAAAPRAAERADRAPRTATWSSRGAPCACWPGRSATRAGRRSTCCSSRWRRELGDRVVACLLTGMGRDGAEGLLAMRRRGALTIAQDEAASVVYGMPREAVTLGAAEQVLPLDEIAPRLLEAAAELAPMTELAAARVLIVDDSLTVRMDLAEAFEEAGFAVAPCATAGGRARGAGPGRRRSRGPRRDPARRRRRRAAGEIRARCATSTGPGPAALHRGRGARPDPRPADRRRRVRRQALRPELRRRPGPRAPPRARADCARASAITVLVIDDSATFRGSDLGRPRAARLPGHHRRDRRGGAAPGGQRCGPTPSSSTASCPGIDGATVIRRIARPGLRHMPCLLLTASDGAQHELRALDAGADAFVRKEDDLVVILARLAALLRSSAGEPAAGDRRACRAQEAPGRRRQPHLPARASRAAPRRGLRRGPGPLRRGGARAAGGPARRLHPARPGDARAVGPGDLPAHQERRRVARHPADHADRARGPRGDDRGAQRRRRRLHRRRATTSRC